MHTFAAFMIELTPGNKPKKIDKRVEAIVANTRVGAIPLDSLLDKSFFQYQPDESIRVEKIDLGFSLPVSANNLPLF